MLHALLKEKKTLLLDGAMGTMLEEMSITLDRKTWSASCLESNPDAILQVHQKYYEAGSDICLTASYQCSYLGFSEDLATEFIKLSVQLCRQAREKSGNANLLIGGSLGPYGACLADGSEFDGKYIDKISHDEIEIFFRHRIKAVINENPDFLAFETFPSLREAKIVCKVLEEFPQVHAYFSFSCRSDSQTCYGDDFAEVVNFFKTQDQVFGIGVNCTHPKFVVNLMKIIKNNSDKKMICYPNSGETFDGHNHCWVNEKEKQEEFYRVVLELIEIGVNIIGGCCRTNYETIKIIREMITKFQKVTN